MTKQDLAGKLGNPPAFLRFSLAWLEDCDNAGYSHQQNEAELLLLCN
jgi:hypothetical protein